LAAGIGLVVRTVSTSPSLLSFTVERTNDTTMSFSDGSEVVLVGDARGRVDATTARGARVVLEQGTTRVRVVHRQASEWHFLAGPFDVEVTGTAFDLSVDATGRAATVVMTEGSVVVRGCGNVEGKRVVHGETLRASCESEARFDVAPTSRPAAEAPSGTPKTVALDDLPRVAPASASAVARTSLSAPAPTATVDDAVATADELWRAGELARGEGAFERASRLRTEFRARFPRDARSANAAFELGQIAFDVEHDYQKAAKWFGAYRREAPSGPLAREALGRSMEAHKRAGDREHASRLAAEYLAQYPDGPHGYLARELQPAVESDR